MPVSSYSKQGYDGQNSRRLWKKWNLPKWCGVIDGKHIAMKKLSNSSGLHYNYKCFIASMLEQLDGNLMEEPGNKLRFTLPLWWFISYDTWLHFSKFNSCCPHYLVNDEAYPLRTFWYINLKIINEIKLQLWWWSACIFEMNPFPSSKNADTSTLLCSALWMESISLNLVIQSIVNQSKLNSLM